MMADSRPLRHPQATVDAIATNHPLRRLLPIQPLGGLQSAVISTQVSRDASCASDATAIARPLSITKSFGMSFSFCSIEQPRIYR
jgi:hypothetical protein